MNASMLKVLAIGAVVIGGGAYLLMNKEQPVANAVGAPLVAVTVPELSPAEADGEAVFNTRCAACHGTNAAGNENAGPPLVHKIYEPNHHADGAFYNAAINGVRAHHWKFGDMPAVQGITEDEVAKVLTYVRALQRANGIQ